MKSKLTSTFIIATAVTILSFGLSYALTVAAGDTPASAMAKYQESIGAHPLHEIKTQTLDGIKSVSIKSSSPDIEIRSEERPDLHVEFESTTWTGGPALKMERVGDNLEISTLPGAGTTTWQVRFFDFDTGRKSNQLTVVLPKSYAQALKVQSHSGDVDLTDLKVQSLAVNTSSGDIDISRCVATDHTLHSSSGSITLEDLNGRVEADASSGDISVKAFKGERVQVQTRSGDIDLESLDTNEIRGSSTSGDVTIKLSEAEYRFNVRARNGDVHNDWASTPTAHKTVDVNTTSGDISIIR